MKLKLFIIVFLLSWLISAVVNLSLTYYKLAQSQKETQKQLALQKQNKEKIEKMTYVEMVHYIAPQFNQDPEEIKQIIWNESNFRIQLHDGGRAKNITAIHDRTFKSWLPQYEKEMGETLNMHSQFDSIKMMSWAFEKGYKTAWTTAVACDSKDGTYSFYSNLMGKHYTVICKPLPKEFAMI